jgi:hypothetical protein
VNIEDIKERRLKVGGTPWKASEYSTDYYKQGYAVKTWNDGYIAECMEDTGHVDFIANAPTDISYLLSIIEQAEKAFREITYSENVTAMNAIAEEALQAIRK